MANTGIFNIIITACIVAGCLLLVAAVVVVILLVKRKGKNPPVELQQNIGAAPTEDGNLPLPQEPMSIPQEQPQPMIPPQGYAEGQIGIDAQAPVDGVAPPDYAPVVPDTVRTEELSDEPAGSFVIVKKVVVTDTTEIIRESIT